MDDVSTFYENLASQKEEKFISQGWKLEQRKVDSKNRPYYTFVNDKNEKYDIYLSDLAYGLVGRGRRTFPDGTVVDSQNGSWE